MKHDYVLFNATFKYNMVTYLYRDWHSYVAYEHAL